MPSKARPRRGDRGKQHEFPAPAQAGGWFDDIVN
jgi:hypothetical protein